MDISLMNRQIGRIGEEAVCAYLQERGHMILERNWRTGHLEVDIISLHKDGIHFTEVKTRVAPLSADPLENVNSAKQRNISKAALRYMSQLRKTREHGTMIQDLEIWFDVASVVLDGGKTTIDYMAGAWLDLHINNY